MGFDRNFKPENVEKLCEEQPWAKDFQKNPKGKLTFGRVPEAFKQAAEGYPAGSGERMAYEGAAKRGFEIYHEQMKADAVELALTFNSRAEAESVSEVLWRHAKELERAKIDSYVRNRLLWIAHVIGHKFKDLNPAAKNKTPGVTQYRFKMRGNPRP